MSTQWFYIQQWARKRWSYVGVEMVFEEALKLFHTLSNSSSESSDNPLAIVRKVSNPSVGKVIQSKEELAEDWVEVIANTRFLNVKEVSNE